MASGDSAGGRSAAQTEWADAYERNGQDARHLQQRLRELAGEVAITEHRIAATYHRLADRALSQGHLDDARRLEGQAGAALRSAEHEQQEAHRPSDPTASASATLGSAQHWTVAVRRTREQAAWQRDQAARLRDEAARQRDAAATDRDERAVDRAVAAGRRDAAADERNASQERWVIHLGASPADGTRQSRAEQSIVDDEVAATYRGQAADDHERAVADRVADAADRLAARDDRLAAARDRAASEVDRAAAARDRAAAVADREQAEIDREAAPDWSGDR
jgi:hypothetical protein